MPYFCVAEHRTKSDSVLPLSDLTGQPPMIGCRPSACPVNECNGNFSSIIGGSNPYRSDMDLSRGSFPRPQNQNYEDYNCQDTGHNPNPSNVIHDFSPFSGVCSRCRKGNSPEGGGSDVLFHKLNSIPEKTSLGIDLGYDPG